MWECAYVYISRQSQHYLLLQQCHLLARLLPLPPQPAVLLQRVFVVIMLCLIFFFIHLGLLTQDINRAVSQYQSL